MSIAWYVGQIIPGKETLAQKTLEYVGAETLLPMIEETLVKRGRKVVEGRQLMAGYIFIKFDKQDRDIWARICGAMGIYTLLPSNMWPMPIADEYVDKLIKGLESGELAEQDNWRWKLVGRYIVVPDGAFAGFGGICSESNFVEIVVDVNIFGRQTPVRIPQGAIQEKDVFDAVPQEHVVKTKALGYTGKRQRAPLARTGEISRKTSKR